MGRPRSAQATHRRIQEKMSEEHLTELGEYSLHVNGGAVMSTVPVVAQNTLDISKDDDATVYLDAANDAVILRFNEEE